MEIRLEHVDYGGSGPVAILLHGLAGTGREWQGTASWLAQTHHVVAPDQRGHGRTERRPADVSCDAFVADVAALLERLERSPALLIGQSLGGQTAFLVAARRPDLVGALVVAEASPSPTSTETVESVRDWLEGWPVPFSSPAAARTFFGGDTPAGRVWAGGLEERDGGWWPSFDVDVMVAALSATVGQSLWDEWKRIECPTLVVRGTKGGLPRPEAQRMVASLPGGRLAEIPDAGHDVHLEAPPEWRDAVERFLASLGT
ncbi:MAG: alpha/beta fold hydrolase [Gaiellaceae bacterium]